MIADLISAEYISGYKLRVAFDDGKSGIVDFSKFISQGGIFSKLRDIEYFKQFVVDPEVHVLAWSKEIDIAPETLYSEATGLPLPAWMTEETQLRAAI
jgi:deoxycytidine triphosphate deaminase